MGGKRKHFTYDREGEWLLRYEGLKDQLGPYNICVSMSNILELNMTIGKLV